MSDIEKTESDDKAKAEKIVAGIPLLSEIQKVEVELYTDNTGDPALQLTFRVKSSVSVDDAFIKQFNAFARTVQDQLRHSGLNRFPYTRLKQAA